MDQLIKILLALQVNEQGEFLPENLNEFREAFYTVYDECYSKNPNEQFINLAVRIADCYDSKNVDTKTILAKLSTLKEQLKLDREGKKFLDDLISFIQDDNFKLAPILHLLHDILYPLCESV